MEVQKNFLEVEWGKRVGLKKRGAK
jgi:hypothetical protein